MIKASGGQRKEKGRERRKRIERLIGSNSFQTEEFHSTDFFLPENLEQSRGGAP